MGKVYCFILGGKIECVWRLMVMVSFIIKVGWDWWCVLEV